MNPIQILLASSVIAGPLGTLAAEPLTRVRNEVHIPDIPGYLTLKGDFHTHTVFSDGLVWPSVRSEEAWREGLDVIAITDHIEYQPHKNDIPTAHERSYEIARPVGDELDVMVIKGSEVTRSMPPGHLNAVFLTNSTDLDVSTWQDSLAAAHEQGAFIFWNHPGWTPQLKDGKVTWYPEHTALVEQGLLNGIEVVNGRQYVPEAHRWALEKNLTMLSNSDIHAPLNLDYRVRAGDPRPMTLVFARERTPDAVKEALFNHRTAVYSGELLVGKEEFLRPIFEKSLEFSHRQITLRGDKRLYIQVRNNSDIDYELEGNGDLPMMHFPWWLTLPAQRTVLLEVRRRAETAEGRHTLEIPYKVTNLLIAPDTPMPANLAFEVAFEP
jgi:hypothetical protein